MERKVIYSKDIELFLDELVNLLFEREYFSFPINAIEYVDRLTHFAEQYIGILPGKTAPPYFDSYGSNMKYITYRANKITLWYIFYQQMGNIFLVRYITNNHVAAQYFCE